MEAWAPARLVSTSGCFWDAGPFEDGQSYELPPEFYLRQVMDVDLMSDQSIADFVSTYGFLLYGDYDERLPVSEVWGYPRALNGWPERFSDQLIITMEERYLGDRYHEWGRGVEGRFGSVDLPVDATPMFELAIETRAGLATLRDLSRLVQQWQKNRLRSLPRTWELSLFDVDPPKDTEEAFDFLVGAINGAMVGVSARLITESHLVGATVYVAAVAQMFNHIAANVDFKICANQPCGRAFVHQVDGLAEYGQYRSEGVIYCSNRCARAQAQREYRRRQAAKKNRAHDQKK